MSDDGQPGSPTADTQVGTVSWRELLAETKLRLNAGGTSELGNSSEFADRATEARWLVEEASGFAGVDLLLHIDDLATVRTVAHLDAMVARRLSGEPIQYVLGHWPFRTLDLMVDPRVLIPRPETEVVCGYALQELDAVAELKTSARPMDRCVVDLGAGSGALGLAIAVERPGTAVWMVEQSAEAALVTRANVAGQGRAARHIRVLEGSWFEPLPPELRGTVDVLVSNPPYVDPRDELPESVRTWEPAAALYSGLDGLADVAHIVGGAPNWLAPHGSLVVEIGETQGDAVAQLARERGFQSVEIKPDLAGRPRALVARLRGG